MYLYEISLKSPRLASDREDISISVKFHNVFIPMISRLSNSLLHYKSCIFRPTIKYVKIDLRLSSFECNLIITRIFLPINFNRPSLSRARPRRRQKRITSRFCNITRQQLRFWKSWIAVVSDGGIRRDELCKCAPALTIGRRIPLETRLHFITVISHASRVRSFAVPLSTGSGSGVPAGVSPTRNVIATRLLHHRSSPLRCNKMPLLRKRESLYRAPFIRVACVGT